MLFSTHTHTENFIVSNKFETFKKAEKQIMADEFIKFFVFLNIKISGLNMYSLPPF